MDTNLTKGPVLKTLLSFTLPFLLASFLQTFYGMADLLVVGQLCDTASVSAVSIGSQFMHMVTVMLVGLATGITVKISNAVGKNEYQNINPLIEAGIQGFAAVSISAMVILLFCVTPITTIIQTPAEAISGCRIYLLVCFIGLPFITFYNVFAAIFRGLGDSKSPMIFVFICALLNIGLDLLFVGPIGMGVFGAALATVLSQAVSVCFAVIMLRKKDLPFELHLFSKSFHQRKIKEIFGLGLPICLQDGIIQVGFMIITIIANSRGLVFATGVGITEKVISFLFLVPSAFLASLSAIVAQNAGAGLFQRAKKMLYVSLMITSCYGMLCFIICQFTACQIISLFVKDPAVIAAGGDYLRSYSSDTFFAGIHFCFSGYFCGMQKPIYSFIHNIISALCFRIPLSYAASVWFPKSLYPMGWAAPIGSAISALICIFFYWHMNRLKNIKKEHSGTY